MAMLSRISVLSGGAAAMFLLGILPLQAQEPEADKPSDRSAPPAAKRFYDPTRRVPAHFGQVGLSLDQKEAIYKIRGKHQPTIDGLERQLAEIQAQMLTECESVLSASQKQLLHDHRTLGASRRGREAPKPEKAKEPAKPAI